MESEMTTQLQAALRPFDPFTLSTEVALPIQGDQVDLIFYLTGLIASGFSETTISQFVPPIPQVSKRVTMTERTPRLDVVSDSYTLAGTLEGKPLNGSGKVFLLFHNLSQTVTFKADKFSLQPKLNICVEYGTFNIDLSVTSVSAEVEGQDEVTQYLKQHGPDLVEQIEAHVNENYAAIEQGINQQFCSW
ncbi:uncharacterized protein LOC143032136 isoform X2 [Oratosquilla oratoria]